MDNIVLLKDEVAEAFKNNYPVVALESALISHGLPIPHNLTCARNVERLIRTAGAVPATIAVIDGKIRVGLTDPQLERLTETDEVYKISRDNLATALAQGTTGGTTVAATMICAIRAGINVFSTGGIGGVHQGWQESFDISADLTELGRTQVTVVCSGVKSLLDLPATIEHLETLGVPVIGLATNELPAFFSRQSGIRLRQTVSNVREAAAIIAHRRRLNIEGGEILAVPPPVQSALPSLEVRHWIDDAVSEATAANFLHRLFLSVL
jgi:pseudouridine-5'-phosphate glycosidase